MFDAEGLVPIFGIIGVFFLPILMVIVIISLKYNKENNQNRLQADLYAKALEAGQSIPDNLFPQPKSNKKSSLERGIVLVAVGVGISAFFLVRNPNNLSQVAIGIIPFFIGIAYLLIHFLEKKHQKPEESGE
ncbi:hypothetical protein FACS1894176_02640 [Bacteroidia bacterium]|nr:hypothetical protein FACS1894176_02640 [Bacteroidia bacterium]